MNPLFRPSARLVAALVVVTSASAQSIYLVGRGHGLVQTSATNLLPVSGTPYGFGAEMQTNVTVTGPSGAALPALVPPVTASGGFIFDQAFSTTAGMLASFPDGTYRVTGTGIPTLTINLPTTTLNSVPRVTASTGTWNAGGVLVVNPSQAVTFTFSPFAEYSAAGAVGNVFFEFGGFNDNVDLGFDALTVPFFGTPATPNAPTSFTIPANTMTAGRIYVGKLSYGRFPTADFTTVANGLVGGGVSKETTFFVTAQTSGTGGAAPVITSQPASRTAVAGSSVTLTGAIAPTTGTLIVQWLRNGDELSSFGPGSRFVQSSNGVSLTINNLLVGDSGEYNMRVITTGGVTTSANATLTVVATGSAPAITSQPMSQRISPNNTVVFGVGVSGAPSPTIQWRRDGTAIAGATNSSLVLTGSAAVAGSYTAVATNSAGSVTSNAATLTLDSTTDVGRLINLSIRTNAGTGAETLIAGFVIGGSGTSGNKSILIRGVGPALTGLGVSGAIANPTLSLYNSSNAVVASNDNWLAADEPTMRAVHAFALPANSLDAAIASTGLAPGNYSAQISGTGGGTGIALAELYDTTTNFTATTPRLINVSARAQVGTGGGILIAGFVVGGSTSRTVLIRAVGPVLNTFGVSGTLEDPTLSVLSGTTVVASNNDWAGDPQTTSVATSLSAFPFAPAFSRDAVVAVTLPPGSYTAQVSGVANTTGVALIEVYEVP